MSLQGIADIANEAEALRRENTALRAELRNALEKANDLRNSLLKYELTPSSEDIREAYRVAVERIKRLEDALRPFAVAYPVFIRPHSNLPKTGVFQSWDTQQTGRVELTVEQLKDAVDALEVKP